MGVVHFAETQQSGTNRALPGEIMFVGTELYSCTSPITIIRYGSHGRSVVPAYTY